MVTSGTLLTVAETKEATLSKKKKSKTEYKNAINCSWAINFIRGRLRDLLCLYIRLDSGTDISEMTVIDQASTRLITSENFNLQ